MKQIPLSYQGKLIELESLKKLIGSNEFESLPIVLQWLHNQGLVAILEENNKTLIKVPRKGEKPVITETDKGIHSLEQQQKILENNIKKLEVKKNSALDETKLHLNNNMKNMVNTTIYYYTYFNNYKFFIVVATFNILYNFNCVIVTKLFCQ